jgi:hypothetical protein
MPHYIELICRTEDELAFQYLGLTLMSKSVRTIVLAGRINESDLVGRLATLSVPFRGFRACDEHVDSLVLISNGTELITMPTMTGDLRPYAALDRNGSAAPLDVGAAQRFYQIADELNEVLG